MREKVPLHLEKSEARESNIPLKGFIGAPLRVPIRDLEGKGFRRDSNIPELRDIL